jgi:hypothetical protein
MKRRHSVVGWCALAGAILVVGGGDVLAQQVRAKPAGAPVKIRQLTGIGPRALMRTPDFAGGSTGNRGQMQWVAVTAQFDSEPEWIDEMAVQTYVLLHDRTTNALKLLKGAATYMDVVRGRGHMIASYVRPVALQRFGEVVGVAVEATVKGEVVAAESEGRLQGKPLPPEWWKSAKLTPVEGYILNKDKTPFAFVAYDDYESLK